MRNGRGYGGGEQSCRSCTSEQRGLKENKVDNEKAYKPDVESELHIPGVCRC